MKNTPKYLSSLGILLLAVILIRCDIYQPQRKFIIAVPRNDAFYTTMVGHVKSFLESNGYQIAVAYTDRNIEANQLVARGQADLAFVNNVSSHIAEELSGDAGMLRSVLPLGRRGLFGFSQQATVGQDARQLFENKTIGVEILNGEGHNNIAELFSRAHITNTKFVQHDKGLFDVRMFWGTPYGKRVQQMLDSGWHEVSFPASWIDFQTLSDPTLEPLVVPGLPGDEHSSTVHTFATDVVLVANKDLGENAIYLLAEAFLQGKMALVRNDAMYRSISESFNTETLLYPLHDGTSSYLRRDRPAFLERYSDALALILSVFVLLFSIVQAVKSRLRQIKKDRIDQYFLEFLDIRSKPDMPVKEQVQKINDLFQRALLQMTNEKMDKGDFHIFSRLLQQELTNLRLP